MLQHIPYYIAVVIFAFSGRIIALNLHDTIETKAQNVISRIVNGESIQLDELYRIQKTEGLIESICEKVRELPPSKIEQCLYELDGLSVVYVEDDESGDITYGGYHNSREIVGLFVDLLFIQDSDLSSKACAILATPGHFPDSLIRDHNDKILKAAQTHPKTPHIVRLLGVTGTANAKKMIISKAVDDSPDIVTAALAKLGDIKAQNQLVKRYKNAEPGREKEELALLLGYVNTVKTVLTLASDFRTEQTYIWREPSAKRSVRVDVIKGLHVAFPEESIFWKPEDKPSDDNYYDEIENWLIDNLGVKWSHARPPFSYEMDAPF